MQTQKEQNLQHLEQNPKQDFALQPLRRYFSLALHDFRTPYLLGLTFLPLLAAFFCFSAILYTFGAQWYAMLFAYLHIDFGFSSAWLSWIQTFADYVLKASVFIFFIFALFGLSLLTSLLICAFITPYVVRYIRDLHYQTHSIDGNENLFISLLWLLGVYVRYVLFWLVLIPLYFVPFVGGFAMLIPGYWLFSKTMVADVGTTIFGKNTFKSIRGTQSNKIRSVILPLFGINLIPIIGFFSPVFALSVLTHLFFDIKSSYEFTITD